MSLLKYPRTPHLEGSRFQPGDEDLDAVPFAELKGRMVVVEEKLDGSNAGVSVSPEGAVRLQSRGHYLTGGPRERHFAMFKQWASAHAAELRALLGERYVMYGEWLYAKHTVYYDALPAYFMEFDLYDKEARVFLSTARRRQLLAGSSVVSVPVLAAGPATSAAALRALVGPSLYKTARWRDVLRHTAEARDLDPERALRETDPSDLMEGLYLKVEGDGVVERRAKLVRADFVTSILDAGVHWLERPILPNRLRATDATDATGDAAKDASADPADPPTTASSSEHAP